MSVVEETMTSLDAFADAVATKATRCLVCHLPEEIVTVIEENESRPISTRRPRRIVVAWVQSQGHELTTNSMYNHFASGHK